MKICCICKKTKNISEFNKNKSSKDGLDNKCAECNRIACREWASKNKERAAERLIEWKEKNKERVISSRKEYYHANKENMKAAALAWYFDNLTKAREARRKYYELNKESISAANKEYRRKNPHISAASNRNRKARAKSAEGSHSPKDILKILKKQNCMCANCKKKVSHSGKDKYHVDHIFPLFLGGGNGPENLQILCQICNLKKGAKNPIEWANQNGRLL